MRRERRGSTTLLLFPGWPFGMAWRPGMLYFCSGAPLGWWQLLIELRPWRVLLARAYARGVE